MKNYLDNKLSKGVKEIIGQAFAKNYLPSHNQRQTQQLFKMVGASSSFKAGCFAGNLLPNKDDSKKGQICRVGKENEPVAFKQQNVQQQPAQKGGRDDQCFESFRPQKKQTQQGSGSKKPKTKVSIPLSKNNSLNNIAVFEKTPEKKIAQAARDRSGARTIHSLLPSPQITPKKLQGKRKQRQSSNKSVLNSPYQASSKKKIFIGLVSVSLTPSRSPLKASK